MLKIAFSYVVILYSRKRAKIKTFPKYLHDITDNTYCVMKINKIEPTKLYNTPKYNRRCP